MEGTAPISVNRSPYRIDVNLLPTSECVTNPSRRVPLDQRDISRASSTMSVRTLDATRQPTIMREKASTTKQT